MPRQKKVKASTPDPVPEFKFRASCASALFTNRKVFGPAEKRELDELMGKIALNKTEAARRTTLENARDCYHTLPVGAETYIMSIVDEYVYKYKDHVSTKAMQKGHICEDEVIDLYNDVFFTNYEKEPEDGYIGENQYFTYHPDVLDRAATLIVDTKCSWSKKTHPKTKKQAISSDYDWQVKVYLYSMRVEFGIHTMSVITDKRWTTGRVFYGLVDTPEELLDFSYEDPSLHYVNDLPLGLRATWFDVTLTDDDVVFMETRAKEGQEFARKYYKELMEKV